MGTVQEDVNGGTHLKRLIGVVTTLLVMLSCSHRSANAKMVTIDFVRITSNSAENIESQLRATLFDQAMAKTVFNVDIGKYDVLFTFENDVDSGFAADVHEIYFDDSSFNSSKQVLADEIKEIFDSLVIMGNPNSGSTAYEIGATPANLPGGKRISLQGGDTIDPIFYDEEFKATAALDSQGKGKDYLDGSNDILGVQFLTLSDGGFDAVVGALQSGNLRLGLHVGGIGTGRESDSFVSRRVSTTPEPASMALMGLGSLLAGCGVVRHKRKQTAKEMMA